MALPHFFIRIKLFPLENDLRLDLFNSVSVYLWPVATIKG